MSDFWPHGEVSRRYGVLHEAGHAERALFVIDRLGVIRYIDVHDIGKQPDNEVLFAELASIENRPATPSRPVRREPQARNPAGGVVMYCSSWCPDCRRARAWLAERNISYTEIDIYRDETAAARVRGWADGKMVTPTFEIDETIVLRFDQRRLKELLG